MQRSGYRKDRKCVRCISRALFERYSDICRSFIVDFLLQRGATDNIGVAYIYFSYKEAKKQTPVNLVASLLQQLVSQKADHIYDLMDVYEKRVKENSRPSVGECIQLLQTVFWSFSKVFIIVDALDERSEADDTRHILLTEIRILLTQSCLLVMSRPSPVSNTDLRMLNAYMSMLARRTSRIIW